MDSFHGIVGVYIILVLSQCLGTRPTWHNCAALQLACNRPHALICEWNVSSCSLTSDCVHAHFTVVLINCSYSLLRNIFTIGQPQFDVANM